MGIPVLAEIERLIIEHGSAAVLKERLALASDQYSALQKQLSEADLRNERLESENTSLRVDLEKAQDSMRNLQEKLIQRHGQDLEAIAEKILVVLTKHEKLNAEQIAQILGIGAPFAVYHLHELQQKMMVMDHHAVRSPVYWSLIQEGRAYLVRHDLLA